MILLFMKKSKQINMSFVDVIWWEKIDTYGYQIYNKWFDYFKNEINSYYYVYLKTDLGVLWRVNKNNEMERKQYFYRLFKK